MFWNLIPITLLVHASDVDCAIMKGVQFGDNKIFWARTPDMGHAEVNISISKQFSFCAWVYMDWIRGFGKYFSG